jgi:phage terminase large subunit GpA-like protein
MLDVTPTYEIDTRWIPRRLLKSAPAAYTLKWSRQERRMLKRKVPMRPSVWAERNIVIPDDSAEPGKYQNKVVPYAAGVMDASFFPTVQEIVLCWPSQCAKTTTVNNCLGYAMDRAPGNAVIVYPDEVTARDNSKDRIQPMISLSPLLRKYRTGYDDDEGAVKIRLTHMILYMAWANSATRLANRPAPYGVADEEDKYPETATKRESSPVDLLRNRARTFAHMRKLWRVSTPTVEGGPIWVALTKEAEVVFDYYPRCPHCKGYQEMAFENIKWEGGKEANPEEVETRKLAWYECATCGKKWADIDKVLAVRAGEWRDRSHGLSIDAALKSVRPRVIGFHLRSWISPFVSISEAAAAFIRGQKDFNKLKKFQNDHAAEPWRTILAERKEDTILNLADDRPRGVVPGGGVVACLLAGVDTQDDGFFYEIRAFGFGLERESWCVQEGKVPTFDALAQVLWGNQYKDADGVVYPVYLTLMDAMGHRTSEVYDFCRSNRGLIYPTMGKQTLASTVTYSNQEFYPGQKKPIPGGLRLYRFDTNHFKNQLAGILEIAPGDPGCWWYHRDVTTDWARQMTVEGINEKGFWDNPQGRDNHAWDCATLLLLGHWILDVSVRFAPGEKKEKQPEKKEPMVMERDQPRGLANYQRPSWLS